MSLSVPLDKIDRRLLDALQDDARITNADLAKKTGLSASPCWRRIRRLESSGESEIRAETIGEMVMEALHQLDQVAYVRFASVYRNFREVSDFGAFIDNEVRPDGDD